MSFPTDLPTMTERIQAATAEIKAARDPASRAAALAAGQELYDRSAGLLLLRAAENETRKALSIPIQYGTRR